jgi:hypothetical protein
MGSLLEENKKIFSKYSFTILNQPFMKMRENSQKEVIRRALGFSKKIEKEKMKQAKVYTFREFPYCFFSAKILRNL